MDTEPTTVPLPSTPAALITGGTSGIGLATARLLHESGFGVAVTGRDPVTAAAARRELPDDVLVIEADSASLADADRVLGEVGERFGRLTALFLNAGISRSAPIASFEEATWDELFAVNAKGAFFLLQKALPLLADGSSVVLNVGIGASRAIPALVTSATKGALLAMVPSLAVELAPRGIRVNAVSPGLIETPIWSKLGAPSAVVDGMLREATARVPLGRIGTPEDVARTVAYLVSEHSAYVTGQEIAVAGGAGLAA